MSIVASGVTKKYGSIQALKGVTLEVKRGSIFGLIGPNGAGKTTFFSLVLGYIQPTTGSLQVLGVAPRDLHRLPGKVGALPQDADLPPTVTIDAALKFFARISNVPSSDIAADIDRVLDIVDLRQWRKAKLRQLSHGMKKRVGLAQALLGKPDLVVLDEPTAGLDPKHAHELIEMISRLRGETTVLISSHNLTELEGLCDHAAILAKGELVRSGTMKEILRSDAEVHIFLGDGPVVEVLLPNVKMSYDEAQRRITVRIDGEGIDRITTDVLRMIIDNGGTVREVHRGQSLLSTYLEISKA